MAQTTKGIRPYTSYNLFFQLEREYLLQTVLGYDPSIDAADIFNPNDDKSNYKGCPPLPSRYDGLVLLKDWHIPGKTVRRKRLHRKSHGKIGFHELNDKISKAWSEADEDVKDFCSRLSEIEATKYKVTNKSQKKNAGKKKQGKTTKNKANKSTKKEADATNVHDKFYNELVTSFDYTADFPQEDVSPDVNCSFLRTVSHDSFPPTTTGSYLTEVDMSDDEIMAIWRSIPIEDKAANNKNSIMSTVKQPDVSGICQGICNSSYPYHQDGWQMKRSQDINFNDTRTSFINEEYDRYKEIGQKFKQQVNLPTGFKKASFTACQA